MRQLVTLMDLVSYNNRDLNLSDDNQCNAVMQFWLPLYLISYLSVWMDVNF